MNSLPVLGEVAGNAWLENVIPWAVVVAVVVWWEVTGDPDEVAPNCTGTDELLEEAFTKLSSVAELAKGELWKTLDKVAVVVKPRSVGLVSVDTFRLGPLATNVSPEMECKDGCPKVEVVTADTKPGFLSDFWSVVPKTGVVVVDDKLGKFWGEAAEAWGDLRVDKGMGLLWNPPKGNCKLAWREPTASNLCTCWEETEDEVVDITSEVVDAVVLPVWARNAFDVVKVELDGTNVGRLIVEGVDFKTVSARVGTWVWPRVEKLNDELPALNTNGLDVWGNKLRPLDNVCEGGFVASGELGELGNDWFAVPREMPLGWSVSFSDFPTAA